MNTELIVVLDVDSREEAMRIVDACDGCEWYKVGAQLFTRAGPEAVRELRDFGKRVMLDLKYHDIPNTVKHAAAAGAALGAELMTLHASGGCDMIAAAREAVEGTNTRLLAVTILTSLNEDMLRNEVGMPDTPRAAVARLSKTAVDAGAHGIVCSPKEIGLVRDVIGPEPIIVSPGIRPTWASRDDQQRVMTPGEAAEEGANYIVVGRPILQHENPREAVSLIKEELG